MLVALLLNLLSGYPGVIDGDTLKFGNVSVRIENIDAPEMNQGRYGELSQYRLQRLIGFKEVTCILSGKTSYYRLLASKCTVDSTDIGAYMVRNCLAYGYRNLSSLQCKRMSYVEPSIYRKSKKN